MLASSIVLIIAVTVCVRQHQISYQDDLFLANVEALAGGENGLDDRVYCEGNGSIDCPISSQKVWAVYNELSMVKGLLGYKATN